MANGIDTLKSYLVALGFSVDQGQYDKANQLIDRFSAKVESHTKGMGRNYAHAAGVVVGALASITGATAGLLDRVSQADLGYQKFALRMFMSVDAAKRLKIATDALGESLEDIAWNPELRQRYGELIRLQERLGPGGDFGERMSRIRDIRFEFTKMKVEGVYALQWIGHHLMTKLVGPINNFEDGLRRINDWIVREMPNWTEKVAGGLKTAIDLSRSLIRFAGDAKIALIAIGAVFARGTPLGQALTVVSLLIAVIDDFYAFIDGRKSSKTLAPIWYTILSIVDKISKAAAVAALSMGRVRELGVKGLIKGDPDPEGGKRFRAQLDAIINSPGYYGEKLDAARKDPVEKDVKKFAQRFALGGPGLAIGGAAVDKFFSRGTPGTETPSLGGRLWRRGNWDDLLSRFFPADQLETARKVMAAESSGNPNAHNPKGGGTGAFGLFQIRGTLHEKDLIKAGIIRDQKDLFDPAKNIQAAAWLYSRSGWAPWEASRAKWGSTTVTTGDINVYVAGSNATPGDIGTGVVQAFRQFQGVGG